MKSTIDPVAALELFLYAVNDSITYHNSIQPTLKNLRTKIARNTYDASKAQQAWCYVTHFAALRYVKEFCSPGTKWHEIFSAATRRAAALELMEYFEDELHSA